MATAQANVEVFFVPERQLVVLAVSPLAPTPREFAIIGTPHSGHPTLLSLIKEPALDGEAKLVVLSWPIDFTDGQIDVHSLDEATRSFSVTPVVSCVYDAGLHIASPPATKATEFVVALFIGIDTRTTRRPIFQTVRRPTIEEVLAASPYDSNYFMYATLESDGAPASRGQLELLVPSFDRLNVELHAELFLDRSERATTVKLNSAQVLATIAREQRQHLRLCRCTPMPRAIELSEAPVAVYVCWRRFILHSRCKAAATVDDPRFTYILGTTAASQDIQSLHRSDQPECVEDLPFMRHSVDGSTKLEAIRRDVDIGDFIVFGWKPSRMTVTLNNILLKELGSPGAAPVAGSSNASQDPALAALGVDPNFTQPPIAEAAAQTDQQADVALALTFIRETQVIVVDKEQDITTLFSDEDLGALLEKAVDGVEMRVRALEHPAFQMLQGFKSDAIGDGDDATAVAFADETNGPVEPLDLLEAVSRTEALSTVRKEALEALTRELGMPSDGLTLFPKIGRSDQALFYLACRLGSLDTLYTKGNGSLPDPRNEVVQRLATLAEPTSAPLAAHAWLAQVFPLGDARVGLLAEWLDQPANSALECAAFLARLLAIPKERRKAALDAVAINIKNAATLPQVLETELPG